MRPDRGPISFIGPLDGRKRVFFGNGKNCSSGVRKVADNKSGGIWETSYPFDDICARAVLREEKMTEQEYLPTQFFLKPGYAMANPESSVIRAVLGNCVAVTFYDRHNCFGGMNQFVFPSTKKREDMTAQYGNVGIRALFRMLLEMGAKRDRLVAQIIGGSECRVLDDEGLGLQNIHLARVVLEQLRVPVVSEDVGGSMGRKVIYHTGSNEMAVFKVDNLRRSDWFKPGMDLRYDCFDGR